MTRASAERGERPFPRYTNVPKIAKRCASCLRIRSVKSFSPCGKGLVRGKCRDCYNLQRRRVRQVWANEI